MKTKIGLSKTLSNRAIASVFIFALLVSSSLNSSAEDAGNNPPECPDKDGNYPYTDACGNPTCTEPNPNDECCDDGVTIVGPGESCCNDITGSRTFGSITATFGSTVSGSDVGGGYCAYSSSATLSFTTVAPYITSVNVSGATVSWEENDAGDIRSLNLSWSGSEDVGDIGLFACSITGINADDSSASATFTVNVAGEIPLDGGFIIKDGASGNIGYNISGGTYNFSGVTVDLGLEVGDDSDSIAATGSASLLPNGDLTIDLSAVSSASYRLKSIEIGVNEANINVTFSNNPTKDRIKVNNADVDVDVDLSANSELGGAVNFVGNYLSGNISLTGTANSEAPIDAFGGQLSGSLTISMDGITFEFDKIEGSNISLVHPELEGEGQNPNCLTGVNFEITDGSITKFDVGALDFVHKNTGIVFGMSGASYDSGAVALDSVSVEFGSTFAFSVESFAINGEGAQSLYSIGRMDVNYDNDPVRFDGMAIWEENGFEVEVEGSIGKGRSFVEFLGQLITNGPSAEHDCNGLYVRAEFTVGAGIPIPYTPLKLITAGGEMGYNYSLDIDDAGQIFADKSCGTYLVGLTFGVSDTGGLVGTNLRTAFAFGVDPSLTFEGNVTIPAVGDSYAAGSINTNYSFWDEDLSANLTTVVQIPPGSGSVVSLSSGPTTFDLFGMNGDPSFRLVASEINGVVWDVITLEGSVTVASRLTPFDLAGRIDGVLSYKNNLQFEYPEGFDPSSCENADNSDDNSDGFGIGFGIKGKLAVDVAATVTNLRISTADEISGTVGVGVSTIFEADVKWPCVLGVCGDDCVKNYDVGVNGNLEIEKNSEGEIRLFGEATFTRGNEESETGTIDLALNSF